MGLDEFFSVAHQRKRVEIEDEQKRLPRSRGKLRHPLQHRQAREQTRTTFARNSLEDAEEAPGACSSLLDTSKPPRDTSIVSANLIFWPKGEVQRRRADRRIHTGR